MSARKLPLEAMLVIDPVTRTDLLVERCIEIARECLAGDPFRSAPELEAEAWALFEGRSSSTGRAPPRWRHAFAVAEIALGTAKSALIARDVLGDC